MINESKLTFLDYIIQLIISVTFATFFILADKESGIILFALLTVVLFFFIAIKTKGKIRFSITAYHTNIIAFIIFCAISALWAEDPSLSLTKALTIFEILVCFSIVKLYFQDLDSIEIPLKIVMWSGYAVVLYSIVFYGFDYIITAIYQSERLYNSFNNINGLGMLSAMAVIINIYFILRYGLKIWSLASIPTLVFILSTGSRKAFITVILGAFLLYVLNDSSKKRSTSKILRIIIVVIIFLISVRVLSGLAIFTGINERMDSFFDLIMNNTSSDSSAIKRKLYVIAGLQQFVKSPIFGIGIDNSRILLLNTVGINTYLHNNYVEMLCCGGVIGFLIYYNIYFYIIREMKRIKPYWDKQASICITILILQLSMDIGAVSYYSKETYFYILIIYLYIENVKKTSNNYSAKNS